MEGLSWYKFFDHLPFWPIYLNGQGATPRKYEPDRWRRTTEGGGPRKETLDEEGLRALKRLHDDGIIDDEEFASKKKKCLGI